MGQTIGIDFGTTNTVVSYKNKRGKIICLRDKNNSKSIPTAIFFRSENDYVIGTEALSFAEAANSEPIVSFKSHLNDNKRYKTTAMNGKSIKVTPKQVTTFFISMIIKSVQERIIKTFGPAEGYIDRAIITVPAKFSPQAKERIKQAAIDAGLSDVELAFEPTAAAAAAYQSLEPTKEVTTILVYDFGGGTFDISIMQATKKNNHVKYNQLHTSGDKALGGNDVTYLIACDILDKVNDTFGLDMSFDDDATGLYRITDQENYDGDLPYALYCENIRKITEAAEKVKINYENDCEVINIRTEKGFELYSYDYSPAIIERIISPIIKRTIAITKESINFAVENEIELDSIVLAGGSSNIPLVHKELSKLFTLDIESLDEVTELISKGAVILNENQLNEITNITSCAYGIIVSEGNILDKFDAIVPINTTLPIKVERKYYLNEDNQDRIILKLYEHDIQNYPNAKRVIHDGIEVVQVFEIGLPLGLKRSSTEISVCFIFERDGSVNITVNIISQGVTIDNKKIVVNKDTNLE